MNLDLMPARRLTPSETRHLPTE